jgi:hypothetical protein
VRRAEGECCSLFLDVYTHALFSSRVTKKVQKKIEVRKKQRLSLLQLMDDVTSNGVYS